MADRKLYAEIVAALASAATAIATLIEPAWFERLFDAAPDDGDGWLETAVVVVLSLAAAALFARRAVARVRRGREGVQAASNRR